MQKEKKKRIPLFLGTLLFSLFFHLSFAVYNLLPKERLVELDPNKYNEPIEVANLPKSYYQKQQPPPQQKTNEQQMAETEDAHNREIDPNAKFLGEHNQVAKEQMKAKRVDDFRNKKGSGAKGLADPTDGTQAPTGEALAKEDTASEDGNQTGEKPNNKKAGVKRNWKTLSLKDLGVGGDGEAEAASDDNLKGVREGEGTVLSTKEFRFYSYYHRIKELLRQYWKPNVERQITRIWNKGKNIHSDELTTKVLVLLDEKGMIQKISKVSSSGFMELDEAAVEAFQKAAPFPNPPKGIVDADGFVRIRWDFILQTETGPAIQWRTQGAMPN